MKLLPPFVWTIAALLLCLINGLVAFYLTAFASVFWLVLSRLEPTRDLVVPPAFRCVASLWSVPWGRDCTASLSMSVAAALLTPMFAATFWNRRGHYWPLVVRSGVAFTLAVVFLGTFLFVPFLQMSPDGARMSLGFAMMMAVSMIVMTGWFVVIMGVPFDFIGAFLLSALNIAVIRSVRRVLPSANSGAQPTDTF